MSGFPSRSSILRLGVLVALFAPSTSALAANHFVRAGATGNGSGSDWTNAYTDLPASLTRGDVYYLAAGTYGPHTFNDALSGTTIITVKAASVTDHGTDTGWSSGYVGEALFQRSTGGSQVFNFTTSYYDVDGMYRGSDWKSGYGIRVSGANHNVTEAEVLCGNGQSAPVDTHDITLRYLNVDGSHAASDSDPLDNGLEFMECYNLTFQYLYSHDVGVNPLQLRGSGGNYGKSGWHDAVNVTVEYSYFAMFGGTWVGSSRHTEIGISDVVQNLVFRYNYIRDGGTTAFIAVPSGSDYNTGNWHNGPWYIYGNVFFYTQNDTRCGAGNGGLIGIGDISFDGSIYILNNTFANLRDGTPGCTRSGAGTGDAFLMPSGVGYKMYMNANAIYLYNNLNWGSYNGSEMFTTPDMGSGTLNYDYQAYYEDGHGTATKDTSAHKQVVATGNPFTNWTSGSTGADFTLVQNTSPGFDTSSLVAGNGVDINGNARTTHTRGAFEFGSSQVPPPAAPTNVHIIR